MFGPFQLCTVGVTVSTIFFLLLSFFNKVILSYIRNCLVKVRITHNDYIINTCLSYTANVNVKLRGD